MAIDYSVVQEHRAKFIDLTPNITVDDLRQEVKRLYDRVEEILQHTTDADLVFVPFDPHASDPHAPADQQNVGWTLAHLVAHVTAANEENAVFSSILARGINIGGRIRYETDWESITTIAQARQRLEESRRMVLAYLEAWPNTPHLDTRREFGSERARELFGEINAPASMIMGLSHMEGHLEQFQEVLRQAKAALQNAETA